MCGIVGGVAAREIWPVLIEGLRRLEYRGYDSAGLAVIDRQGTMHRKRALGKVSALAAMVEADPIPGSTGIAHTRWATHGAPCTENAHPHVSNGTIAVVHNGIVENHDTLRDALRRLGYRFESETDTEVIAHLVEYHYRETKDLLSAVSRAVARLEGAFTFGAVCTEEPDRIVAARQGSPLVVGIGDGHGFIASDTYALLPVATHFIYLEEGDVVDLRRANVAIFDRSGQRVERTLREAQASGAVAEKGGYRHYMLKEIHEQPGVVTRALDEWVADGRLIEERFGAAAPLLDRVRALHLVACGTSHHAALVGRHWFESFGIPSHVETASEYRYRRQVVGPGTLLVTLSQSGETADTLAVLRQAKGMGFLGSLAVCNVATSSLVREADHAMITRAGPEIGVASTKAFTAQLVALYLLALALRRRQREEPALERQWIAALRAVPEQLRSLLEGRHGLEGIAESLAARHHALFLGRGIQYPVAMEGALKLKEISYIHAEAYPAGELKHGPLALVDKEMPIVCTLPHDALQPKTLSNLREVQARGGRVLVFADDRALGALGDGMEPVAVGRVTEEVAPIVFAVPLQLLAYHTAVAKGADVDQPRNLAKSVTVE